MSLLINISNDSNITWEYDHVSYPTSDCTNILVFLEKCSQLICTNIPKLKILLKDNDECIQLINKLTRIMIIDIETRGKKIKHIVQVAYKICDYNLNDIESKNYLINDGSGMNDFYNKIPIQLIKKIGIPPKKCMELLKQDMQNVHYFSGHNIKSFDMPEIIKYAKTCGTVINGIVDECMIDTMSVPKTLLNLKNNPDEQKCHLADYDIIMSQEVLRELLKLKIMFF